MSSPSKLKDFLSNGVDINDYRDDEFNNIEENDDSDDASLDLDAQLQSDDDDHELNKKIENKFNKLGGGKGGENVIKPTVVKSNLDAEANVFDDDGGDGVKKKKKKKKTRRGRRGGKAAKFDGTSVLPNPRNFANLKDLEDYTSTLITSIGCCYDLQNNYPNACNFLKELYKYHSDIYKSDVVNMKITANKKGLVKFFFSDDSKQNLNWLVAVHCFWNAVVLLTV